MKLAQPDLTLSLRSPYNHTLSLFLYFLFPERSKLNGHNPKILQNFGFGFFLRIATYSVGSSGKLCVLGSSSRLFSCVGEYSILLVC